MEWKTGTERKAEKSEAKSNAHGLHVGSQCITWLQCIWGGGRSDENAGTDNGGGAGT